MGIEGGRKQGFWSNQQAQAAHVQGEKLRVVAAQLGTRSDLCGAEALRLEVQETRDRSESLCRSARRRANGVECRQGSLVLDQIPGGEPCW